MMKRVKTLLSGGYESYAAACQKAYVACTTGAARHATALLLVLGIVILVAGAADVSLASGAEPGKGVKGGDDRIANVTARIFQLIEGNLGALIMVTAGLAAIVSAALGAYRAAVGLLVVAVGAFILRSLVDIFFCYDGVAS